MAHCLTAGRRAIVTCQPFSRGCRSADSVSSLLMCAKAKKRSNQGQTTRSSSDGFGPVNNYQTCLLLQQRYCHGNAKTKVLPEPQGPIRPCSATRAHIAVLSHKGPYGRAQPQGPILRCSATRAHIAVLSPHTSAKAASQRTWG